MNFLSLFCSSSSQLTFNKADLKSPSKLAMPCHQKVGSRHKSLARQALLLCLVVPVFGQMCFVRGWPVPIKDKILTSKIQRCVRERRQPVRSMHKVPLDKDVRVRVITSKIKDTKAAGELLDYVDTIVGKPEFNHIHAGATYTKLSNIRKKGHLGPKELERNVLVRLQQRLQGMLLRREVGARQMANILWAVANLFTGLKPLLEVVPTLAAQISLKAGDLKQQELSNSLWAAAELQDDAPEVLNIIAAVAAEIPLKPGKMNTQDLSNNLLAAAKLRVAAPQVVKTVPALAAQIPLKASSMTQQDLSNSLWALKDFVDASPAVPQAVQALVQNVPSKITSMNAQELSNTAEALVFLGESFPIAQQHDIIAASAAQLKRSLPRLKGKKLTLSVPMVVWACRRCNVEDPRLFAAAADRFSSHDLLALLSPWGLCALNLGSELACFRVFS